VGASVVRGATAGRLASSDEERPQHLLAISSKTFRFVYPPSKRPGPAPLLNTRKVSFSPISLIASHICSDVKLVSAAKALSTNATNSGSWTVVSPEGSRPGTLMTGGAATTGDEVGELGLGPKAACQSA
jgi:hypothetical protein